MTDGVAIRDWIEYVGIHVPPAVRVDVPRRVSQRGSNRDLFAIYILQNVDGRSLHHVGHSEKVAPANRRGIQSELNAAILRRHDRRKWRWRHVAAVETEFPKSRKIRRLPQNRYRQYQQCRPHSIPLA